MTDIDGLDIRVVPAPSGGRAMRGRWPAVVEAARAASRGGEAISFAADARTFRSARSSVHSPRFKRPGEHMHMSYRDGVVHVWITFDHLTGLGS